MSGLCVEMLLDLDPGWRQCDILVDLLVVNDNFRTSDWLSGAYADPKA
jgi:hypothetical protein